jgi:hypothetical protein
MGAVNYYRSLINQSGNGFISDIAAFQLGGSTARRLNRNYLGSAISVFENGGATLEDIGFSGSLVDNSAITSHVGVNSGFVDKIYDQSGNAKDWTYNAVTGDRPQIVDAGSLITDASGRAVAKFFEEGSQLRASLLDASSVGSPSTVFFKLKVNTTPSGNRQIFGPETSSGGFSRTFFRWTTSPATAASPQFRVGSPTAIYFPYSESEIVITILYNVASSIVRVNGIQVGSGDIGTNNSSAYCLGAYFDRTLSNSPSVRFEMTDFIYYNSNQTSNFAAIEEILNS